MRPEAKTRSRNGGGLPGLFGPASAPLPRGGGHITHHQPKQSTVRENGTTPIAGAVAPDQES